MKTELYIIESIEKLNPIEIYTGGSVRGILDDIKAEARSVVIDATTDAGRREIASLAYKVARSKTTLDAMGKKLGEEARATIESINSERRVIVAELDALKDEVRKPLTDYEDREKARVAGHESAIAGISAMVCNAIESRDLLTIEGAAFSLGLIDTSGLEEFKCRADTEIAAGVHRLMQIENEVHAARVEADRIAQEAAEMAAKAQADRELRIAKEAAENARIQAEREAQGVADRIAEENRKSEAARDAERKAEADRIAEENRKSEAARDAERKAEADRIAALERSKIETEERHKKQIADFAEAVQIEAQGKESARLANIEFERAATAKLAANKKHRSTIREAAMSDLVAGGFSGPSALAIVALIEDGKVSGITINF